jgi:ABC-type nitrate/sulfonate/bicarbonate transport system substrate-binding protein
MSQHGVAPADYTIKPAGAGVYRFKAMTEDKSNAAAVLNPPFTVEAQAMGMKSLGNLVALLGPYQGVGVFAMRSWAEANKDALERFLAAEVEALRYVRDPAHRAESVALLVDEEKLPHDIAERTYDQLVDPGFGFTPDAKLDMAGFRNMLALRAEVEGKTAAAPDRYLDLGYYERAMALLGR